MTSRSENEADRATVIAAVPGLCERGRLILPCDGKRPIHEGWPRRTYAADEIVTELSRVADPMIGLRLGPGSYIDIEADSPEEEQACAELFAGCDVPVTPTFKSTRGKHRLFAWDDRLAATDAAVVSYRGTNGAKLGIRVGAGNKGAQSIIPPSPDREWLVSWDDVEPAKLPDRVIERIITAAKRQPAAQQARITAANGAPTNSRATAAALEAIFCIKPDANEHDGSKRLFAWCCRVVEHGLGGRPAVAVIRLGEAFHPFPRPYSDSEIRTRLRDAERKVDCGSAIAADRQAVAKFTFAELQRQYPNLNPPVVDGLIRAGETCNIIAYSKFGKSWLVYNLALSLIAGRKWLGQFATSSGNVLFVDNELHKPTLASRIAKAAAAMKIPPEVYAESLAVWSLRGDIRSLADLDDDFAKIEPGTVKLIVLDALYRFNIAGVSENDNAAMATMYNTLDRIAERTGAAIVVIHHASKGSQSDKRITDVGAGAGAQSRAADCHLILREHEAPGVAVLEAAVRSFAPVQPLGLRWEFPLWLPVEGVDTTALKTKDSASTRRQKKSDEDGAAKVLAALEAESPLTARQLRHKTGISRERLQRLLDWIESEGRIAGEDVMKRGNETRQYKAVKSRFE